MEIIWRYFIGENQELRVFEWGNKKYAISNQGIFARIKKNKRKKILKPVIATSGYLKATEIIADENGLYYGKYKLRLTNQEVKTMFQKMVSSWFKACGSAR